MGLIPWQRLVLDWQKCLQSTTQHKDVEERCSDNEAHNCSPSYQRSAPEKEGGEAERQCSAVVEKEGQ